MVARTHKTTRRMSEAKMTAKKQPLESSGVENAEDLSLSKYSLLFKYQNSEQVDANVRSLARPVEAYRLALDLALLRRHLKGPRILDFPMGAGRLYPHFLDDYDVYGFDISPVYVERAQIAFPHIADRFQLNSFETVDASTKFDSVYSMRVLSRLKDRAIAARNIAALLTPGGRWLFSLPPEDFHAPDFTRALESNGFKVILLHRYDAYSVYGSLPRTLDYLYGSLILRAVGMGLMPHWGYRLIDKILSVYGTYFVVAERS